MTARLKIVITSSFCIFLLFMSWSCRGEEWQFRSAYFWSTIFSLDSLKMDFISQHRINRLYIRYFDVVVKSDGSIMPNATIKFQDSVPEYIDVVPTVYIVNKCLSKDVSSLGPMIVKRILQMNNTHDIKNVKEIQIDCDWTASTRNKYFELLSDIRKEAAGKGLSLSVTIRLHQLGGPVPPADRGVLMMYNTGNVIRPDGTNPILDVRHVNPYLRYLRDYKLPLATAYPIYQWKLLYRDKHFIGFVHYDGEYPILPTDSVSDCFVPLSAIMEVKGKIDRQRRDFQDEIILFDLNNHNITRFKPDDYEKIFNH